MKKQRVAATQKEVFFDHSGSKAQKVKCCGLYRKASRAIFSVENLCFSSRSPVRMLNGRLAALVEWTIRPYWRSPQQNRVQSHMVYTDRVTLEIHIHVLRSLELGKNSPSGFNPLLPR